MSTRAVAGRWGGIMPTGAIPVLAAQGITFAEWRRDWGAAIWPHATAGFFKVKQQIPRILEQMVLT